MAMTRFGTMRLPALPDVVAPDGSDVRELLCLEGGGMAHWELEAGETSNAEAHRSVDEIWYILSGRGEMWRRLGDQEETVELEPGVCLTIPVGTAFQWRSVGPGTLAVVAVTMPPWPGHHEAYLVEGIWPSTVAGA
jgi:mannose-6-phosphate isomerase-like protein (cupin superfamily)